MSVRTAVAVATMIVAVKAVLIGLTMRRWQAIAAGAQVTLHSTWTGCMIWVFSAAAGGVAVGALAAWFAFARHRLRLPTSRSKP